MIVQQLAREPTLMSNYILKISVGESFSVLAISTGKCESEHFCHKSTLLFTLNTKQAGESHPSYRCQEAALE